MFNLQDSVLFLTAGRKALVDEVSLTLEGDELIDAKNYLLNEASDYEIMSLLIDGVLPDEKYNFAAEMVLFDKLQEQADNSEIIPEWAGADLVKGLGPVHPLSTSKVVMEHLMESGISEEAMISREEKVLEVLNQWLELPNLTLEHYELMEKWYNQLSPVEEKEVVDEQEEPVEEAKGRKRAAAAGAAVGAGAAVAAQKWLASPAGKAAVQKYGGKAAALKSKFGPKASMLLGRAKQAAAGKGVDPVTGLPTTMGPKDVAQVAKHKVKAGAAKAKGAAGQAKGGIKGAFTTAKQKTGAALKAGKEKALAGKKAAVSQVAKTKGAYAKGAKGKLVPSGKMVGGGKLAGLKAAAATPAGAAGLAVGGAAAAALAAVAAHKIYKRFFSQAARACRGMSGDTKTACMKKARVGAINKEIAAMKSQVSKCAKTKNPEKCKAGIQKKITGLQAKAQKAAA